MPIRKYPLHQHFTMAMIKSAVVTMPADADICACGVREGRIWIYTEEPQIAGPETQRLFYLVYPGGSVPELTSYVSTMRMSLGFSVDIYVEKAPTNDAGTEACGCLETIDGKHFLVVDLIKYPQLKADETVSIGDWVVMENYNLGKAESPLYRHLLGVTSEDIYDRHPDVIAVFKGVAA